MQIDAILLGFAIGVLTGATGIGGGTLMAPALIFLLRIDPFIAVGTDLFVSVLTKAVGALLHRRAHSTIAEALWPLCLGGAIGACLGGVLLWLLKAHVDVPAAQIVLRRAIGIALLACCAAMAFSWSERRRRAATGAAGFFASAGGVIGAVTALTGVGVGALSVPLLYLSAKGRSMAAVVGTSLAFGTAVTAVGTVAQIALRDVNYALSLWLLIGSVPGVAAGSVLAIRSGAVLRPIIVALVAISAVRLIA